MPKYSKRRVQFRNFGVSPCSGASLPSVAVPFMTPAIPVMPAMPPLPMPVLRGPQFPFGAQPQAVTVAQPFVSKTNRGQASNSKEAQVGEDLSLEEYACLPNFSSESDKTRMKDPTDIIIIDFDRTLLSTPNINKDLVTKSGRQVLENKLAPGSRWWQSSIVLEVAIREGKWNTKLLEIARMVNSHKNMLLVLTTSRGQSDLPIILEALAAQGVERVDHFSCSNLEKVNKEDNLEKQTRSRHNLTVDSESKAALLELLLDTYDTLERIMIFDSNHTDASSYSRKASKFVQQGWLNAEAIYIADIVASSHILPLEVERKLIGDVLSASVESETFERSVVVIGWIHKVTSESRKRILKEFKDLDFDQFECGGIELAGSSLPPDMRWLASDLFKPKKWSAIRYQVRNKQAVLFLDESRTKLCRGESLPLVSLKLGRVRVDDCMVQLPQSFEVETMIYENRKLDIQKKFLKGVE